MCFDHGKVFDFEGWELCHWLFLAEILKSMQDQAQLHNREGKGNLIGENLEGWISLALK